MTLSSVQPEQRIGSAMDPIIRAEFPSVYDEVVVVAYGQAVSIDRVGVKEKDGENEVLACECKRRLSPELVEQAARWIGSAEYVVVAVQEPLAQSRKHKERLAECDGLGVGVFYVRPSGKAIEKLRARRLHRSDNMILDALTELQQHGPQAGSAGVKRFANDGLDALRAHLRLYPGATESELARDLCMTRRERLALRKLADRNELSEHGMTCGGTPRRYVCTIEGVGE